MSVTFDRDFARSVLPRSVLTIALFGELLGQALDELFELFQRHRLDLRICWADSVEQLAFQRLADGVVQLFEGLRLSSLNSMNE